MELTILGSGTGEPSLSRNAPGYHLSSDSWEILVDCGCHTLVQLLKTGNSYRTLNGVFLTHTHADHVSGLPALLHALLYLPPAREHPFEIVGPPGTRALVEAFFEVIFKKSPPFQLDILELELNGSTTLKRGRVRISWRKTDHTDNSIGYRFEKDDHTLVLTGDCTYDNSLVQLCKQADVVVTDCSFPDDFKVRGHMVPRECGRLAREADVKHLILSHLYPAASPDAERVVSCQTEFHGKTTLAEDLMKIVVS